MSTLSDATWRAAIVGRWTARIVGSLMALFFLAFLVGEGPPPLLKLSLQQNLQFFGMAGLFIGLLLAWKWEGWGGLVALASFVLLVCSDRRFNTTWFFLIPAAVAILHVLCWWRITSGAPASGTSWEVSKTVLWSVAAPVGIFILLSANEIFGQPPLMTPALKPSAELAGEWRGAIIHRVPGSSRGQQSPIDLLISPDGVVSGHASDLAFTGRILNNRSWFGAFMHWRDPYRIQCDGMDAGVIVRGTRMYGGISIGPEPLGGEPNRLTLQKQ